MIRDGFRIIPWICTLALAIAAISCQKSTQKDSWGVVGNTINQWQCILVGQPNIGDTSFKFTIGSVWQSEFFDTLNTLPIQVCFIAPDSLDFGLILNGKSLIQIKGNASFWPSSFSSEKIGIYPMGWKPRPFVIDPNLWKTALKKGKNVLSFSVDGVNRSTQEWSQCGLYVNGPFSENVESGLPLSSVGMTVDHLPRMDIWVPQNLINKQTKTKASLNISCASSKLCESVNADIQLKIRGFSSSSFPKKQYSFHIIDSTDKKNKMNLLGMEAASRWILQGPYSDPSLIRNPLAYELWRRMGYWASYSKYVELVLNNNYQGVYLLMERIEISKNRLILDEKSSDSDAFLIQLNRPNKQDSTITVGGRSFIIENDAQLKKNPLLKGKIVTALDETFSSLKYNSLNYELADWNSFADFIILQEILKNVDAYMVSTFMHKDNSAIDDRLIAGPVWDFDLSIGSSNVMAGAKFEGLIIETNPNILPFFKDLYRHAEFRELLQTRYAKWRTQLFTDQELTMMIDGFVQDISQEAISRNFTRYPLFGMEKFLSHPGLKANYSEEISSLKSWLNQRLIWLDKIWLVAEK